MVAGVIIFFIALALLFFIKWGISEYSSNDEELLFSRASAVSDSLLSEGYPGDWQAGSLDLCNESLMRNVTMGIFRDKWTDIISKEKVDKLLQINSTACGYNAIRTSYNIPGDFYIDIPSMGAEIGKKGTGENEIILRRYAVYNASPTLVEIRVWK